MNDHTPASAATVDEPLTRNNDQHLFETERTLESVRQELEVHGFAAVDVVFRAGSKQRKILVLGPDPKYNAVCDDSQWFTCKVKNGSEGLVGARTLFTDCGPGALTIVN